MDIVDLRYIVFALDSKIESHDGKVFSKLADARIFVKDCIEEKWADKLILGSFVLDDSGEMNIEFIETFGMHTSKKKIEQLDLFATLHNR